MCIICTNLFRPDDVVPNWAARKLIQDYTKQQLLGGEHEDQSSISVAHDPGSDKDTSAMPSWYTKQDSNEPDEATERVIEVNVREILERTRQQSGPADDSMNGDGQYGEDCSSSISRVVDDADGAYDHESTASPQQYGPHPPRWQQIKAQASQESQNPQYKPAISSLFEWKPTQPKAPLFSGPKATLHPHLYSDSAVQRKKMSATQHLKTQERQLATPTTAASDSLGPGFTKSTTSAAPEADTMSLVRRKSHADPPQTRTSLMRQGALPAGQPKGAETKSNDFDPMEILDLNRRRSLRGGGSADDAGSAQARHSLRLMLKEKRAKSKRKLKPGASVDDIEDAEDDDELEEKLAMLARKAGITDAERAEVEKLIEEERRQTEQELREKLLGSSSMYAINPTGQGVDPKSHSIYDVSLGRKLDDRKLYPLHQVPDGPLHPKEYYEQRREQDTFYDVRTGAKYSGIAKDDLRDISNIDRLIRNLQGISDETLTDTAGAELMNQQQSQPLIPQRRVSFARPSSGTGTVQSDESATGSPLTGNTDIASFLRAIRQDLEGHTQTVGKGVAAAGSARSDLGKPTSSPVSASKVQVPKGPMTKSTLAALSTLNAPPKKPVTVSRNRPSSSSSIANESTHADLPDQGSSNPTAAAAPSDTLLRSKKAAVAAKRYSATAQARKILNDPMIKSALKNPNSGLQDEERERIVRRVAGKALLNSLSDQIESSEKALNRMRGKAYVFGSRRF